MKPNSPTKIIILMFSVVFFGSCQTTAHKPKIDMVHVEGGTFSMGTNYSEEREGPAHKVKLSDFYISRSEVTQELYQNVMGTSPKTFRDSNLPMHSVSWYDVIEFCNALSLIDGLDQVYVIEKDRVDEQNMNRSDKLKWKVSLVNSANGYRLPTEAEWEYAARGGKLSRGFLYAGSNNYSEISWHQQNSNGESRPVMSKKPNELGLYDMMGNVAEWCWNWYESYSADEQTDPRGPDSGSERSIRGGFYSLHSGFMRLTARFGGLSPDEVKDYVGIRLVKNS